MTAEVLSLDGARVSARCVIDASTPSPGWPELVAAAVEQLRRFVGRKADEQLGDAPRRKLIYVTYEEVVEPPEPPTAA